MKFVPVDFLPKVSQERAPLKNMIKILDEFLDGNAKIVKVEFDEDEYLTSHDCRGSLANAIAHYRYPIRVAVRSGEVYLIKK